jgi:hypothetical protein
MQGLACVFEGMTHQSAAGRRLDWVRGILFVKGGCILSRWG